MGNKPHTHQSFFSTTIPFLSANLRFPLVWNETLINMTFGSRELMLSVLHVKFRLFWKKRLLPRLGNGKWIYYANTRGGTTGETDADFGLKSWFMFRKSRNTHFRKGQWYKEICSRWQLKSCWHLKQSISDCRFCIGTNHCKNIGSNFH